MKTFLDPLLFSTDSKTRVAPVISLCSCFIDTFLKNGFLTRLSIYERDHRGEQRMSKMRTKSKSVYFCESLAAHAGSIQEVFMKHEPSEITGNITRAKLRG
jgi:hypothetical protein